MRKLYRVLQRYFDGSLGMLDRKGRIERSSVMMHAYEFVAKSDIDGCYMEFGVFQGESFARAYHAANFWMNSGKAINCSLTNKNMYAFDSFEGLPTLLSEDQKSDYKVFSPGQYSCSESQFRRNLVKKGVKVEHVRSCAGFFSQSLVSEPALSINERAAVVHIDVDLLSSTVDVLVYLESRLQDGSIILVDDYFCYRGRRDQGVRAAIDAWVERQTEWELQPYFNYGWSGMAFIVNNKI